MDMEESPLEEPLAHKAHKGKRTKRQRPLSPINVPALTTSSSSSGGDGGGGGGGDNCSIPSPILTSCDETTYESTTDEEEDMANCLILLAQSGGGKRNEGCGKGSEKLNTRKFTDKAATVAGLYGYECKTCNRTFSSFQALGGHRASHKRPKTATAEEKKPLVAPPLDQYDRYYDDQQGKLKNITTTTTTLSLLLGSTNHHHHNKSKVHECSICGSEFSSGQALGGHMRRHRTLTSAQITTMNTNTNDHQTHEHQPEKRRNVLPLDLNLPAPDDDWDTKFPFTGSNQSPLVFSSPALVDCHY